MINLLNIDLLNLIFKMLNNKDLFNLFLINKYFYHHIKILYIKKIILYDSIQKYRIPSDSIIKLKIESTYIYECELNFFQRLYYYYRLGYQKVIKKKTYISSYKYIIYVKPIILQINNFSNLQHIEFNDFFNQPLNFTFPPLIKSIKFGKRFQHSIDNLPDTIESIEFVYNALFDQKINRYPLNLKRIKFGKCFFYDINNLPDTVEVIHMGYSSYNKMNIWKLPSNLKILILRGNIKITCEIPDSVKVYAYELSFFKNINPQHKNINYYFYCSDMDKYFFNYNRYNIIF